MLYANYPAYSSYEPQWQDTSDFDQLAEDFGHGHQLFDADLGLNFDYDQRVPTYATPTVSFPRRSLAPRVPPSSYGPPTNSGAEARYRRAVAELRAAESEYTARITAQAEARHRAQEAYTLQVEIEALRQQRAREQALLLRQRRQLQEAAQQQAILAHSEKVKQARRTELEKMKRVALTIAALRQRKLEAEQARIRQQAAIQHMLAAPVRVHPSLERHVAFSPRTAPPHEGSTVFSQGPCFRPTPTRAAQHSGPRGRTLPTPPTTDEVDLPELLRILGLAPQQNEDTSRRSALKPASATPVKLVTTEAHSKRPDENQQAPAELDLQEIFDFVQNLLRPEGASNDEHPLKASKAPTSPVSQDKGKGKAAPAPESTSWEQEVRGLLENRLQIETDQEMQDTMQAIINSLQDQGASTEPGASSSKVRLEDASRTASARASSVERLAALHSASAEKSGASSSYRSSPSELAVSTPPTPATSLDRISRIRSSLQSLRSSFVFPSTIDFDAAGTELAFTPGNAPLRAYEHALNGLLTQLDSVESDGDDDVRVHRREAVLEVERALESVDIEISKRRPQSPVPSAPVEASAESEQVEVAGYDVEDTTKPSDEAVETAQDGPIAVSSGKPTQPESTHQTTSAEILAVPDVVDVPVEADAEPSSTDAIPPVVIADYAVSTAATDVEQDSGEVDVAPSLAPVDFIAEGASLSATDVVEAAGPQPIHSLPDPEPATLAPAKSITDSPASPSLGDEKTEASSAATSPQPASKSFLASLAPEQFMFPPQRHEVQGADEGEDLEDSVVIDKEDNSSERSWSDVESSI